MCPTCGCRPGYSCRIDLSGGAVVLDEPLQPDGSPVVEHGWCVPAGVLGFKACSACTGERESNHGSQGPKRNHRRRRGAPKLAPQLRPRADDEDGEDDGDDDEDDED